MPITPPPSPFAIRGDVKDCRRTIIPSILINSAFSPPGAHEPTLSLLLQPKTQSLYGYSPRKIYALRVGHCLIIPVYLSWARSTMLLIHEVVWFQWAHNHKRTEDLMIIGAISQCRWSTRGLTLSHPVKGVRAANRRTALEELSHSFQHDYMLSDSGAQQGECIWHRDHLYL